MDVTLFDICSSIRSIVSIGEVKPDDTVPTIRSRSRLPWFIVVRTDDQIIFFDSYVVRNNGRKTYLLVKADGKDGKGSVSMNRVRGITPGKAIITPRNEGAGVFVRPWEGLPGFFTQLLLDPSSFDEGKCKCRRIVGPETMARELGGIVLAFDAMRSDRPRRGFASFKDRKQAYLLISTLASHCREVLGMKDEGQSPITCPNVTWYEVPTGPCLFHMDVVVSRTLNPSASEEEIIKHCKWAAGHVFSSCYGPMPMETVRWTDSDARTLSSHLIFSWRPTRTWMKMTAFSNNHQAMIPFARLVQKEMKDRAIGLVRTKDSERAPPFDLSTYTKGRGWRLAEQAKPSNEKRILHRTDNRKRGTFEDFNSSFIEIPEREKEKYISFIGEKRKLDADQKYGNERVGRATTRKGKHEKTKRQRLR